MDNIMLNGTDPAVLQALKYGDWHVDLKDPAKSIVFASETRDGQALSDAVPMMVPLDLERVHQAILQALSAHLSQGIDPPGFPLDVGVLRFRGEKIRANRYALRLSRKNIDPFDRLRLGDAATRILMDPDFRDGGIILIAGEHGAGKSTTARTTVVERLKAYGGYCLTAEQPIEVEMEGFHGKGYLEQIDATANGYKYEVEHAMRKFPASSRSMFLFGEVLEEKAAAEVVRLGPRGNLVITTIHSKDIRGAIELLIAYAEQGGETRARELLGQSLRAVVHQRLEGGRALVSAIKANERLKNAIGTPNVDLGHIGEAIDNCKLEQARSMLNSAQSQMPQQRALRP